MLDSRRDTSPWKIRGGITHEFVRSARLDIPLYTSRLQASSQAQATPTTSAFMLQDAIVPGNNVSSSALSAFDDARQLVRLIQCPQCSKPFHNPVTLPCGNSLCRDCLPEAEEREHISYPDLPGRRQGFQCPFRESCGVQHPASDCNVDVTLTKLMESIAEVMTTWRLAKKVQRVDMPLYPSRDTRWDEKDGKQEYFGGRLLATYEQAAEGRLDRDSDLEYPDDAHDHQEWHVQDASVLQDLLQNTQREVDCQVCYSLMLDPVTTLCGHTLCRKCMARVLDHSLHCPVCRRDLAMPPLLASQPNNATLANLLDGLCPDLVAERRRASELEERGGHGPSSVPLFVCTLGFPFQPTFLRIFEPRYKLMLRRAMETNRQFGMLMYNRYNEPQGELGNVHFYQYGTMLEIVQIQTMSDGTSLIETTGLYKFRVKSHDLLDGYLVGQVERLDDVGFVEEERIEAEETSVVLTDTEDVAAQINHMSTQELFAASKDFVIRMQSRSANWLQQRVLDINGQPPEEAAAFPYWFASVLPISEEEKYKLMGARTVRERLKITATWIRRIESQRW